jgi:hypothetical protein
VDAASIPQSTLHQWLEHLYNHHTLQLPLQVQVSGYSYRYVLIQKNRLPKNLNRSCRIRIQEVLMIRHNHDILFVHFQCPLYQQPMIPVQAFENEWPPYLTIKLSLPYSSGPGPEIYDTSTVWGRSNCNAPLGQRLSRSPARPACSFT